MKLFIDTANIDEIKEIAGWGVLSGVTTNPSLLAKEGNSNTSEIIKQITDIVDGPISAEVISLDSGEMVNEARELAKISNNVTIKLPMTPDGLAAAKVLSSENIKTNVTLVFSANQALLASHVGATFVSPFVGRLDDISNNGMTVVKDCVDIFELHGLNTQVIAASIRHPQHVIDAALIGAHVATIPYSVFKLMVKHPLTDAGIEKFLSDWKKIK